MQDLAATIDSAFDARDDFNADTAPAEIRDAVEETLARLDDGSLRVAEPDNGGWHVNEWAKKAVLLSFKLAGNTVIEGGHTHYFDKVPLKFAATDQAGTPECLHGIALCQAHVDIVLGQLFATGVDDVRPLVDGLRRQWNVGRDDQIPGLDLLFQVTGVVIDDQAEASEERVFVPSQQDDDSDDEDGRDEEDANQPLDRSAASSGRLGHSGQNSCVEVADAGGNLNFVVCRVCRR